VKRIPAYRDDLHQALMAAEQAVRDARLYLSQAITAREAADRAKALQGVVWGLQRAGEKVAEGLTFAGKRYASATRALARAGK